MPGKTCNIILVTIAHCFIRIKNTCDGSVCYATGISKCVGNNIVFSIQGGGSLNVNYTDIANHGFDNIEDFKEDLLAELEACSNNVTLEGDVMLPDDIEVQLEKFGTTSFPMCRKSDGENCQIIYCVEEGVETYQEAGTTIKLTPAQFLTAYEKCKPAKTFIDRGCYYLTSEEDLPAQKRNYVLFDQYTDGTQVCTVPAGEAPAADGSNFVTNINEYTMASDKLGSLPVLNSEIKTKKGRALDVCGGAAGFELTVAILLAAASVVDDLASLAAKIIPEPGYKWDLLGFEVNQHPAKKLVHCDIADAEGTVSSNEQAFYALGGDTKQFITVGDSKDTIMKLLPDADACGCLGDPTCLLTDADLTTPLTLAANTAVEVCPIFVCVIDPDAKREEA